ncbi:uncharacterized protein LOC108472015 [Gossypium arboreum]|uniref:uncharacterized protein LOC108472015 n=1 Tax=Gossypium arboreum TaxID=29729 RepID=UPI0008196D28|nr:uncharacterized protein LOC108472015 [Gossypium arboreum]
MGTRGRRGIRPESFAYDAIPNLDTSETLVSPVTETDAESYDSVARDDALSQAMLRILERVAGANTGSGGRGSVTERLCLNGAEIFRGIAGVASSVAEYWVEATERIMDDLDFTEEQKLKGAVSLHRNERKYVGANYTDARQREFLNLTQGDCSIPEYEAEFLRLDCYTRGMVTTDLRVLIAPQRKQDFSALVEEVKHSERQNREKGKSKSDSKSSSAGMRSKKKARTNGPKIVGPTVAPTGVPICQLCNGRHPGECWRATEACLRCGSTEH